MISAARVTLPLETYTNFNRKQVNEIISRKPSFVGLKESGHFYPSQISGGMQKRTA
jgi:phospholipid/cholesterol/gamma-HCH transport system ATP-binding protein